MIVHHCPQRSDEWFQLRSGLFTASSAGRIITPTGKYSTQSKGLVNEIIAERLGAGDPPFNPTFWMQRGIDLEPDAIARYEIDHEKDIDLVGFITNDEATAGCSPDGIIEGSSGFEIKCLKGSNHVGYLLEEKLPDEFKAQVHMSMAITGLRTWQYMGYHDLIRPHYVSVSWDTFTDQCSEYLAKFLGELDQAWGLFMEGES